MYSNYSILKTEKTKIYSVMINQNLKEKIVVIKHAKSRLIVRSFDMNE